MYFSCWRIEEYFRCQKQKFQFENFRVRKLASINALNFYITTVMAFLALISMKSETNKLKAAILERADPIRKKYIFITIVFRPAQLVSLPSQKKAFGDGSKRNVPAIDNCVLYFWNDNFQSICYLSHDHGTSCRTHFYKIFVLIYIFY